MKKLLSIVLTLVIVLSVTILPTANVAAKGDELETATTSLSEFMVMANQNSGVVPLAAATPLTSVYVARMYYGIVSYDYDNDSLTYYIDYYGAEDFSSSTIGKSPTGSGVPDIVGDYLFVTVESGWAVTYRYATWNSSSANTSILGWEIRNDLSGVSIGRVSYTYVDNSDVLTTTTGTFTYTAENFNTLYGGNYARTDYVIVY
jgi:hypothetical protein